MPFATDRILSRAMGQAIVASALLLLAAAADARADLLFTPYAGVNFGGGTVDRRANLGASLTWLGSSGLGLEVDFGFVPDFFEPRGLDIDVLGDNNVTTVMANIVVGRPGGGVRPYVSAGGGLLRSQVGDFGELFDTVDTGFGVNAGAGVRVGSPRLSLRGDVRYFRSMGSVDEVILEDLLGDFAFWRATAGIAIGF
jgi:hypothetical protein